VNWKGVPVSEKSNLRLIILGILIFSLMATLISRLYFLQIMEGDEYRAAAASNTVREVVEPAVRGLILDQAGRPLVSNRTSIVVTIDRQELKQQAKSGDQVIKRLAKILGKAPESITELLMPCGTGKTLRVCRGYG
jgi:penicillin-binding protein 2